MNMFFIYHFSLAHRFCDGPSGVLIQKIDEWPILQKITHQNQSAYNNMPFIKFQLIWRTSDFGTKFAQKNMNDEPFEQMNVKISI